MNTLLRMYPGDDWAVLAANVVVQVTVVTLAAWLLVRLGGRWNAAWRYMAWLAALGCVLASPALACLMQGTGAALVTLRPAPVAEPTDMPIVPVRQSGVAETAPQAATNDVRAEPGGRSSGPGAEDRPSRGVATPDVLRAIAGGALAVWMLGVGLLAARWCHGLRLAAALRREARPLDPAAAAESLRRVRQALRTARLPPVATSARVDRPIMVGLVRPLVILPEEALQSLGESELADVLVHECAHAVCGHQVIGLLQRAATALFWPHPLVHLMNRGLARAREEVCDNFVLGRSDARRYARTLLDLSQSLVGCSPRPVAFGLFHSRWKLEDRIAGLLDRRRKTMTRVSRLTAAALVAVFLLPMLAIAGTKVVEPAPIELRLVNKMVDAFPEKTDLSTPESAMAALCRAYARQDADAYKGLIWWAKGEPAADAASRLPEATAKKALDTEIVAVLTYREDLAAVIVRMNESDGGLPIVNWHFGRIDGQWKYFDVWPDLHLAYELHSIEAAEQRFAAEKDMLWGYFVHLREDVKQRGSPAAKREEGRSASTAPSRSAKYRREMEDWKANFWRLGLELDPSGLQLQAVQYAVLDHDPVPAYLSQLKKMQKSYRQRIEEADTEAWKAQQRRVQMQISWNAGFKDVTGEDLGLLEARQGARAHVALLSSNGPGGKKWVVTKAMGTRDGQPVCWCIPVEVKKGEEVRIVLSKDNTFDLRALYDEAMKEPAEPGDKEGPK
jgi:beta-lactamase regulating signal transducer with metallopeptidase domain